MTVSVFSSMLAYLRAVYRGVRSVVGSCFTSLPYLLNIRSGDLRKEVTEQYPDPVSSRTPDDLPPRTRGFLFNDIDKCTGCKECVGVCPTSCITVENDSNALMTKTWVAVYDIDISRCTFCGLCVEACGPQSLVHTRGFEGAVYRPEDLIRRFGKGRISLEQKGRWESTQGELNDEQEGGFLA